MTQGELGIKPNTEKSTKEVLSEMKEPSVPPEIQKLLDSEPPEAPSTDDYTGNTITFNNNKQLFDASSFKQKIELDEDE